MGNDKRNDNARGYHDCREGKPRESASVLRTFLGAVVPGIDPVGNSEEYNKGYDQGEVDKKR
ncbi:MAG: hypothetical protein ABIC82_04340 [bacterium]